MFDIILQLHAEEADNVADNTTGNTDSVAENNSDNNSGNTDSISVESNTGVYGLKFDPRTGRPAVSFIAKQSNAQQPEQQQEQTAQQPEQEVQEEQAKQEEQPAAQGQPLIKTDMQPQEAQPYNASELILAMQSGTVDERRIPMEYAMQYAAIKAQQAQQAAMQQAQKQTENNAAAQQDQLREQQAFYNRVEAMAKEETLKSLGLTQDELDAAEYTDDKELEAKAAQYETALAWNRSRIAEAIQREIYASKQAKQAQEDIYNGINAYTNELMAKEPNFQNINVMMESHYKTLPYDEAKDIAGAIEAYKNGNITEQQCETLKSYYEKTRIAYYAKLNNLNTTPTKVKPPKVEQRGNGNAGNTNTVTIESLRNAKTMKEKSSIIGKLLLGNR